MYPKALHIDHKGIKFQSPHSRFKGPHHITLMFWFVLWMRISNSFCLISSGVIVLIARVGEDAPIPSLTCPSLPRRNASRPGPWTPTPPAAIAHLSRGSRPRLFPFEHVITRPHPTPPFHPTPSYFNSPCVSSRLQPSFLPAAFPAPPLHSAMTFPMYFAAVLCCSEGVGG